MKLVTFQALLAPYLAKILIHTSVKLVTRNDRTFHRVRMHFNPHEREARDHGEITAGLLLGILIHTSVKLVTAGFVFMVPSVRF